MKKILFVSSEAVPYVKTGGLADVVGSLPKYFDKKEYDVRVVIPKYACMDRSFLPNLKFLCHFYVNLNWRRQYVGIFESEYHGVHFYFVDNEFYFAGESPYNNIYEDVEKFAYFPGQYLLVCRILILLRTLSIAMTGRQDLFQCFCIRYLEMIIFMRESKPCLRFITCSFRDAGEFKRLWISQDFRHIFLMQMN